MELEKILPIAISTLALFLSIYAYIKTNAIANANLELNIYNLIRSSKSSLFEISKQLMLLEENKLKKAENAKAIYDSLIEDYVTSYEEACSKYLDNKVDKVRFEKSFKNDIRKIVEDEEINKIVNFGKPSAKSQYGALLKIYGMWFNKEK